MPTPFYKSPLAENPYQSQGLKRRNAADADYYEADEVATVDPYKGNWAAEATRSHLANVGNDFTSGMAVLGNKLAGDDAGAAAAGKRYAEAAAEAREMGPEVQSFEDAGAAGGGLNYLKALAYQGTAMIPDMAAMATGAGVAGVAGRQVAKGVVRRSIADQIENKVAREAAEAAQQKGAREVVERVLTSAPDGAGAVSGVVRAANAAPDALTRKAVMREAAAIAGRTPAHQATVKAAGKWAGRVGGTAASLPQANAGNVELLADENTSRGDAAVLLGGSVVGAASNLVPFEKFLHGFGDDVARAALEKSEKFLPHVAKKFAEQGLAEGTQEVAQQATQQATHAIVMRDASQFMSKDVLWNQYVPAFIGGFALGGVMGGSGAVVSRGAGASRGVVRSGMDAVRENLGKFADQRRAWQAKKEGVSETPAGESGGKGWRDTVSDVAGKAAGAARRGATSAREAFTAAEETVRGKWDGMRFNSADGAADGGTGARSLFKTNAQHIDRAEDLEAWTNGATTPSKVPERNRNPIEFQPEGKKDKDWRARNMAMGLVENDAAVWADETLARDFSFSLLRVMRGRTLADSDHELISNGLANGWISQQNLNKLAGAGPAMLEANDESTQWDDADLEGGKKPKKIDGQLQPKSDQYEGEEGEAESFNTGMFARANGDLPAPTALERLVATPIDSPDYAGVQAEAQQDLLHGGNDKRVFVERAGAEHLFDAKLAQTGSVALNTTTEDGRRQLVDLGSLAQVMRAQNGGSVHDGLKQAINSLHVAGVDVDWSTLKPGEIKIGDSAAKLTAVQVAELTGGPQPALRPARARIGQAPAAKDEIRAKYDAQLARNEPSTGAPTKLKRVFDAEGNEILVRAPRGTKKTIVDRGNEPQGGNDSGEINHARTYGAQPSALKSNGEDKISPNNSGIEGVGGSTAASEAAAKLVGPAKVRRDLDRIAKKIGVDAEQIVSINETTRIKQPRALHNMEHGPGTLRQVTVASVVLRDGSVHKVGGVPVYLTARTTPAGKTVKFDRARTKGGNDTRTDGKVTADTKLQDLPKDERIAHGIKGGKAKLDAQFPETVRFYADGKLSALGEVYERKLAALESDPKIALNYFERALNGEFDSLRVRESRWDADTDSAKASGAEADPKNRGSYPTVTPPNRDVEMKGPAATGEKSELKPNFTLRTPKLDASTKKKRKVLTRIGKADAEAKRVEDRKTAAATLKAKATLSARKKAAVAEVHKQMDALERDVDSTAFKTWSEKLTGHRHLDDMPLSALAKVTAELNAMRESKLAPLRWTKKTTVLNARDTTRRATEGRAPKEARTPARDRGADPSVPLKQGEIRLNSASNAGGPQARRTAKLPADLAAINSVPTLMRMHNARGTSSERQAQIQERVAQIEHMTKKAGQVDHARSQDNPLHQVPAKKFAAVIDALKAALKPEGNTPVVDLLRAVLPHANPTQAATIEWLLSEGGALANAHLAALTEEFKLYGNGEMGGSVLIPDTGTTRALDLDVRHRAPWGADGVHMDPIHTLIHEAVHAATLLAERDIPAVGKEFDALLRAAREAAMAEGLPLTHFYGLSQTQEFIAEANSNPEFAAFLSRHKDSRGATLWQRFLDAVMKALGMKVTPRNRSLLGATLDATAKAVQKNARIVAKGQRRGGAGVRLNSANNNDEGGSKALVVREGSKALVPPARAEEPPVRPGFEPESLKALTDIINTSLPPEARTLLDKVLNRRAVQKKMDEFYADNPAALRAIGDASAGLENRIAYAYMMWKAGAFNHAGVGGRHAFIQLDDDLMAAVGAASPSDYAQRIFSDIANGRVMAYKARNQKYDVRKIEERSRGQIDAALNALGDIREKIAEPLSKVFDGKLKRMLDTGIPAMRELATFIQRPHGAFDEDRGMLPSVRTETYLRSREMFRPLSGLSKRDRVSVMDALQRQLLAVDPDPAQAAADKKRWEAKPVRVRQATKAIRAEMDRMYDYLKAAGVDIGAREHFFPVVFDTDGPRSHARLTELYMREKFHAKIREFYGHYEGDTPTTAGGGKPAHGVPAADPVHLDYFEKRRAKWDGQGQHKVAAVNESIVEAMTHGTAADVEKQLAASLRREEKYAETGRGISRALREAFTLERRYMQARIDQLKDQADVIPEDAKATDGKPKAGERKWVSDDKTPIEELVKRLVDGALNDPGDLSGGGKASPQFRSERFRVSEFVYELGDAADKKLFASTQSKDAVTVMSSYVNGAVRRAEFTKRAMPHTLTKQAVFVRARAAGKTVAQANAAADAHEKEHGKGANLLLMFERMKAQGATDKQIDEASDQLKAALGLYGLGQSPTLNAVSPTLAAKFSGRKTKAAIEGVQAYENARLLPLSLLSSLVDPIGIAVRTGGDFGVAWDGFKTGLRSLWNKDTQGEMLDALEMLGGADDFMHVLAAHAAFDGAPNTSASKVNELVFKANGMHHLVRATRFMAMQAGHGFMLKHATGAANGDVKSLRYFNELGLRVGDVTSQWQLSPDGKGKEFAKVLTGSERAKLMGLVHGVITVDSAGQAKGVTTAEAEAAQDELDRDDRVRSALNAFIDEAVLRPNSQQVPLWHSDPYMGVVAQYKGFLYAFNDQIFGRMARELRHGNYKALLAAGAYLPVALMAELMREWIQYGMDGNPRRAEWGATEYALLAAERTGFVPPQKAAIADAVQDVKRNNLPGTTFMGPAVGQGKNVLDALGGRRDLGKEFESALPASAAWRHWNDDAADKADGMQRRSAA